MFTFKKIVKQPKPGSRYNYDVMGMDYDLNDSFPSSEEEYEDELDQKHGSSSFNFEGILRQKEQEDFSLLSKLSQDRDTLIRQHLQKRLRESMLEELRTQACVLFEQGDLQELERVETKIKHVENRPQSKFVVKLTDFNPSDPPKDWKYNEACRKIAEIEARNEKRKEYHSLINEESKVSEYEESEVSEYEKSEEVSEYEEPVQVSRKRRVTRSMGKQPVSKKRKIIHISEDESG